MSQVHLAYGLPFFQSPKDTQTNVSIGLRITAVVLGTLAVIVGALILLNTSGLSHLGTTVGWSPVAVGTFLMAVGISIKCVKHQSEITSKNESQFGTSGGHKTETEKNVGDDKPHQEEQKKNTLASNEATSLSTATEKMKKVELSSIQQQILSDFTPQMVEALGGVDKVLEFPEIKDWNGILNPKQLKAPVVRGYLEKGRPFLLFCYYKYDLKIHQLDVASEYVCRTSNGGWGNAFAPDLDNLNLCWSQSIVDNTLAAHFMLDKISRIMRGEAVGTLEQFPDIYVVNKPRDKGTWRPRNAYLEGEKLEQFMGLDVFFYERKPREGSSELFLYDPRISEGENVKRYRNKFPRD